MWAFPAVCRRRSSAVLPTKFPSFPNPRPSIPPRAISVSLLFSFVVQIVLWVMDTVFFVLPTWGEKAGAIRRPSTRRFLYKAGI